MKISAKKGCIKIDGLDETFYGRSINSCALEIDSKFKSFEISNLNYIGPFCRVFGSYWYGETGMAYRFVCSMDERQESGNYWFLIMSSKVITSVSKEQMDKWYDKYFEDLRNKDFDKNGIKNKI